MLWLAFALDVLRHEKVLAIPDDVGEMGNPVAQNDHTSLLCQLKIDLDVAVAIDEIVDVGMILDVLLGEEHKVFAVLSHISRFLIVSPLQTAVLSPVKPKPHAPAGMEPGEKPLAY